MHTPHRWNSYPEYAVGQPVVTACSHSSGPQHQIIILLQYFYFYYGNNKVGFYTPDQLLCPCLVSSNSNPQRVSFLFSLRRITDLINWSLNAVDSLCSMRSLGSEEPKCPGGTFPARYMMDGGRSGTSCAWRDCLLRTLKTSTYSEPWERGSCWSELA